MNLDQIPRISLTHLPTPLEEAPRLAKELGLRKLLVKRDDCTTLGMGGNKARKLEYLIADALDKKADVVMTDGGPQSNHARLTAAACRKAGIENCILFLGGPKYNEISGNLILDQILGAQVRFMENATVKDMENAMSQEAEALISKGINPYVIPIGGSTPLGSVGYVQAIKEIADQLPEEDKAPVIFVAVGSAGTFAGCALGIKLFLPEAQLIGISVASRTKTLCKLAATEINGCAELIGSEIRVQPEELNIDDNYYGKMYGVASEAGNNAVFLAARTEGIFLDPIYTGKAMSGLIDMAKCGSLDKNRTVIFIHTGGTPALFAEGMSY